MLTLLAAVSLFSLMIAVIVLARWIVVSVAFSSRHPLAGMVA
jgi:hypothetical protein